jgi:Tfp pilus assembly protein PilX
MRNFAKRRTSASRQKGVVLLISLIMLVAMTMAGVALMRSVDTSVAVAGNLAFKEASVMSADLGIQAAARQLEVSNVGATLYNTNTGAGYFSSQPFIEPDWFDLASWNDGVLLNSGTPDSAGNVIRYVIHRMCTVPDVPWDDPNNQCGKFKTTAAASGGSKSTTALPIEGPPMLYYRITARVDGPRNTVSVVQTSVLLSIGS